MARKKQTDGQLSLFNDSFFDTQPRQEEAAIMAHSSKGDVKEVMVSDGEELAKTQVKESEDGEFSLSIEAPKSAAVTGKAAEKIRVRGKRLRLKATFEDGAVVCDTSATQTMIETIRRIGVERVAGLNMEVCHIPLVSQEINPRYARWTKPMGDGWYLMAQSDTRQKYMQMASLISQLGVDVKVELADFDAVESSVPLKTEVKRKKKAQMEVTIGGRTITHGSDIVFTFLDVVELIGVSKVKKTGIRVGHFPIVTHDKVANNQIQTSTGEWLTVPSVTKDKYKVLRVISSMTHTPLDIKIIE